MSALDPAHTQAYCIGARAHRGSHHATVNLHIESKKRTEDDKSECDNLWNEGALQGASSSRIYHCLPRRKERRHPWISACTILRQLQQSHQNSGAMHQGAPYRSLRCNGNRITAPVSPPDTYGDRTGMLTGAFYQRWLQHGMEASSTHRNCPVNHRRCHRRKGSPAV